MRTLATAALLSALATQAWAQSAVRSPVEPWRQPTAPASQPGDNRARATSSEDATMPTPAELREARSLASAIFAKPGAGERAADKAAPVVEPNLAAVQPKPEWTADKNGLAVGGKGVRVATPF